MTVDVIRSCGPTERTVVGRQGGLRFTRQPPGPPEGRIGQLERARPRHGSDDAAQHPESDALQLRRFELGDGRLVKRDIRAEDALRDPVSKPSSAHRRTQDRAAGEDLRFDLALVVPTHAPNDGESRLAGAYPALT